MRITDIIKQLELLAPSDYAEDFDNVGLLVGNKQNKVKGVLVTLDTLETVVDEAIEKNCNLIVSFHPIIFKGLKKLNGSTYVERTVMKAIKYDIAIFAIHTAFDNSKIGVNSIICDVLGLSNKKILLPQKQTIKKLTTYVPINQSDHLRQTLFNAGAGNIGNYDHCSFNSDGTGTYRGNEHSNPTIGTKGKLQREPETQISVTFNKHLEAAILRSLFEHHPYEAVAYEVTTLENTDQSIGMGMIGKLAKPLQTEKFLEFVKTKLKVPTIRHSKLLSQTVSTVAVLGGSGSFAIPAAKRAGADIFLTADLKYHDFFSADDTIVIADIGHYESEQFTKNFLVDYLSKKFTNFAVVLATTDTNPVKYL